MPSEMFQTIDTLLTTRYPCPRTFWMLEAYPPDGVVEIHAGGHGDNHLANHVDLVRARAMLVEAGYAVQAHTAIKAGYALAQVTSLHVTRTEHGSQHRDNLFSVGPHYHLATTAPGLPWHLCRLKRDNGERHIGNRMLCGVYRDNWPYRTGSDVKVGSLCHACLLASRDTPPEALPKDIGNITMFTPLPNCVLRAATDGPWHIKVQSAAVGSTACGIDAASLPEQTHDAVNQEAVCKDCMKLHQAEQAAAELAAQDATLAAQLANPTDHGPGPTELADALHSAVSSYYNASVQTPFLKVVHRATFMVYFNKRTLRVMVEEEPL